YPVINIFGFGIAGDFLTNYTNAKINQPINDSIFKTKLISTYDSNALRQEQGFWENSRPIALSDEEQENYVFQDSVYVRTKAIKDSLYNATITTFNPMGVLLSGAYYKKRNNQLGIEPLLSTVGFNTVEGLVLGLNPYWKHGLGKGDSLNIVWRNHYGFANKK